MEGVSRRVANMVSYLVEIEEPFLFICSEVSSTAEPDKKENRTKILRICVFLLLLFHHVTRHW